MADVIAFFFAGRLSCTRRMPSDLSVIMSLIFHLLWQFGRNLSDGCCGALLCFRHGAARVQAIDFARAETELVENLFVVFSERRGALCRDFCHTMNLNGTADGGAQVAACSFEGNDDVICPQLRIVDDFLWPPDGAEGDMNAVEDFIPMRHRL